MDADFYPVQDAVKDIKLDSDTPLLVDIGGGKGHDVMEFKKKFPSLPGRLPRVYCEILYFTVVQD